MSGIDSRIQNRDTNAAAVVLRMRGKKRFDAEILLRKLTGKRILRVEREK